MAVRQSDEPSGRRAVVDHQRLWDRIDELVDAMPADVAQRLPQDGVEQLDHYVYGTPKKESAE